METNMKNRQIVSRQMHSTTGHDMWLVGYVFENKQSGIDTIKSIAERKSLLTGLDAQKLCTLITEYGQACLECGCETNTIHDKHYILAMNTAHSKLCNFLTELQQ